MNDWNSTSFWMGVSIALFAFVCACIGGYARSYMQEKGKSLATKEDIAEITRKIETVKDELGLKNYKKRMYLEKQFAAYLDIHDVIEKFRAEVFTASHPSLTSDMKKRLFKEQDTGLMNEITRILEKHGIYLPKAIADGLVEICNTYRSLEFHLTWVDSDYARQNTLKPLLLETAKTRERIRLDLFPEQDT